MSVSFNEFLPGDDIEICLNHGTKIKGEIHNISLGQLTLLQAHTGAYRVLEESDCKTIRLIDRTEPDPWDTPLRENWLPNDLVAGVVNGRPDAAIMLCKILISGVSESNLNEQSKAYICTILSQLIMTKDALYFMNPSVKRSRSPRSWKKSNEVWHEVRGEFWSFYSERPKTLTDSRLNQGIFANVADRLHMSESSVKRHYYDFEEILEETMPQRIDEIRELLSHLSPRYRG